MFVWGYLNSVLFGVMFVVLYLAVFGVLFAVILAVSFGVLYLAALENMCGFPVSSIFLYLVQFVVC